jgi:hypothetical protein
VIKQSIGLRKLKFQDPTKVKKTKSSTCQKLQELAITSYEVNTVRENQLFMNEDNSYNSTQYQHGSGENVYFTHQTYIERVDKVGIQLVLADYRTINKLKKQPKYVYCNHKSSCS